MRSAWNELDCHVDSRLAMTRRRDFRRPKDAKPTPIPPPAAQAEVSHPAAHQLELHLHREPNSPADPHDNDYGYRTYYGIYPPGGASVEAATGEKRELLKIPATGKELPHSRSTRRHLKLFDQTDSGKTAYFSVRFENAKGEPGPWGPLFHAVIP
ncbi:MAG: hypothetical protein LBF50_08035 [Azoarcus sp.]|jgi:hypothetical protein|nr:hypothetical protein [Azoarcus sp.]